jgi:hydroxypyruvate isomerase
MLRFCANLGLLWTDRPLLARIEAAARAGFRAVEMHWPYDVPASEVARAVRHHDVSLLGINTAPGNFAAGEVGLGAVPGRERDFQATVDQALEYCQAAGATAIHAMAGNIAPADRKAARAVLVENLRIAAAKALAQQVTLLLEPLNPNDNPGYFYARLAQAVSIIEELSLPNIRLQFDVYHVARSEGDILVKLGKYRHHLGNVQVAGVPARAEPDEGEIAYPAVFAALEKLEYAGWVGCEYHPRGDTGQGLGWMDRMGLR